jgi:hypothetical protein
MEKEHLVFQICLLHVSVTELNACPMPNTENPIALEKLA